MQTVLIVITILIAGFMFLNFYARKKMKNMPAVEDHPHIITLTDKNFQQQVKNKLILVDFWAGWCAPCRMMAPVLNELASELDGNQHIGKVNIEQYQSLAQTCQVRSIPTLILYKNGKEVNRYVGIKPKAFLKDQFRKHG